MYKTILVPLDGSDRAEKILPHVREMAQLYGASVVLLQVVEPSMTVVTPYDMVPYYDSEQVEQWTQDARDYLNGLAGSMRLEADRVKVVVQQGPIVHTILDVAEREHADLIAMASHGRTGLSRVFYGSIAAGILNQADRPLLLIRAESADG